MRPVQAGKREGFFLRTKRRKKTLRRGAMGVVSNNAHGPAEQKFSRRFF
jgi:hypothetical protein